MDQGIAVSVVGRGDAARAKVDGYARLFGWELVELGPATELVVVLGGRTPNARIDGLRAVRPALRVVQARDLDGWDVSAPVRAALERQDVPWLEALSALRPGSEVSIPGLRLDTERLHCPVPLRIDGGSVAGRRIGSALLRGVGVDLQDARVEGVLLADLDDPDLRGLRLEDGAVASLDIRRGRWDGADLTRGRVVAAAIEGADLRGVAWQGVSLEGVRFVRCLLDGVDLGDVPHPDLVFDGCGLMDARLVVAGSTAVVACDLRGADLRGSLLAGLDLTDSRLDGAVLGGIAMMLVDVGEPESAPGVEVLCAPCDHTSIRLTAQGLAVVLELRGGDGPHPWLAAHFVRGADRRTVRSGDEGPGWLVASIRSWDAIPSWDDVRVSGRASLDAGRRFWAALLEVDAPGHPPSDGGSQDLAGLFARVRAARDDERAWAVLLDGLQEADGPLGDAVRRALAGEHVSERSAGLPDDGRMRVRFHRRPGTERLLPLVRELEVRDRGLPMKVVRALVAHPACGLIESVELRDACRDAGRLLTLPARRAVLHGAATFEWACFVGMDHPNPEILELALPRGFGHAGPDAELGRILAQQLPGLQVVYVGRWGPVSLAGLALDRLYLWAPHVTSLDLTGCRAREVHVLAYPDTPDLPACEAALRALDGVETYALRWMASDGMRDHAEARGAALVDEIDWPIWITS